jgi:hypothetical protein
LSPESLHQSRRRRICAVTPFITPVTACICRFHSRIVNSRQQLPLGRDHLAIIWVKDTTRTHEEDSQAHTRIAGAFERRLHAAQRHVRHHPGAKATRLAPNDYVTESSRLLAVRTLAIEKRKAATQQCRLCRRGLRAAGTTVVRVGKLVNVPDTVMETLTIPGSMSDGDLQVHMQGLYDRVLPYKDAFEAKGLSPDVLANLTDGIKALETARAAYDATIQDAASADEALRENQDLSSVTIRALESMAPRATVADREVVKKLKVARRVGPRKAQPVAVASGVATTPSSTTPSSTVPPSTTPGTPAPPRNTES